MRSELELGDMVKYQFEVDDDLWNQWKNTVPRTKSLDERIRELIESDAEGRVQVSNAARASEQKTLTGVSEPLLDELYKRKEREESYEDFIWRLLAEYDEGGSEQ